MFTRNPLWQKLTCYLLLLLISGLISSHLSLANAQSKSDLKQIDKQLKKSAKTLKKNRALRAKTKKNILTTEKEIAQNQSRSKQTKQKYKQIQAKTQTLQASLNNIKTQINQSKGGLGDLLASNYLMGKQSGLKVALSQQGTQHTARLNHYAKLLSAARQQQIANFGAMQTQLLNKSRALQKQKTRLASLSKTLADEQAKLASLKSKRLLMVQSLDKQISDDSDQITQLKKRKARLEKVLKKIAKQQQAKAKKAAKQAAKLAKESRQKKPGTQNDSKPKLVGLNQNKSLPMPVNAKIVARFGDKRHGSGLPWAGILLQGRAGSDIRAISSGEVVYADWLQGYGQMVIIDHGKGMMSLYGHNQSIQASVGDYVKQSAIIANMGDTAGLKKAALYFEIRQNGQAQNPLKWCRS